MSSREGYHDDYSEECVHWTTTWDNSNHAHKFTDLQRVYRLQQVLSIGTCPCLLCKNLGWIVEHPPALQLQLRSPKLQMSSSSVESGICGKGIAPVQVYFLQSYFTYIYICIHINIYIYIVIPEKVEE